MRPGSMLPTNPTFRREQAILAYSQQALGPVNSPDALKKVQRMLEWGELDDLRGDMTDHREYAKDILTLITNGEVITPRPWERHDYMIDELMKFMTRSAFRLQPPRIRSEIERVLAWHSFYEGLIAQKIPWWKMPIPEQPGQWPPDMPGPLPVPDGVDGPPPLQVEQVFGGGGEMGQPEIGGPDLGAGPGGGQPEATAGVRGPGVGSMDSLQIQGLNT